MKRLPQSKMVKRVVALAAAALMAFELIPFSSLTANAATLDIARAALQTQQKQPDLEKWTQLSKAMIRHLTVQKPQ